MLLSSRQRSANFGDRRMEGSACVHISSSLLIVKYNQLIA
jgi:hypothetical protein